MPASDPFSAALSPDNERRDDALYVQDDRASRVLPVSPRQDEVSAASLQEESTYDLLLSKVRAAIVRGEACCHVNDKEWDRSWWQEALDAAVRLREEIDYAR